MIRVCYMVDAAFLGGAEHYIARLACALDPARFEASVLLRHTEDVDLDAWARGLGAQGIRVLRTPMNLPYRPGHAVAILRALDTLRPHVVHVNMPGPYNGQNALLVPLARLAGARTVVTEHLPMVERSPKRGALKDVAYRWLDLAITVSRANAAYVSGRQRVAESRVRVIYNGVADVPRPPDGGATMRARLGAERGDVVIWFVGNLIPHKGLCDLIKALSSVARTGWRLGVIGDGSDRDAALLAARAGGVESRVQFLGHQPPSAVRAALPAGDILALPSRMEGLPYVVLEAMAAGLPVVSTAVFGIPEAVADGDTGLLVAPGDAPALAGALRVLLASEGTRRRMGAAARARYEALFTLDRQVAATSAVYRELVTGRSAT